MSDYIFGKSMDDILQQLFGDGPYQPNRAILHTKQYIKAAKKLERLGIVTIECDSKFYQTATPVKRREA